MGPNNSQPQFSMDYLNQISASTAKKHGLSMFQYIIIGVSAVLLVVIVWAVFAVIMSGRVNSYQQLAARLATTESIASGAQAKLKSTDLRTLNSNLKIYLTDTNRDITAPLQSVGVDSTKLDSSIVKSESADAINARLENARLNAEYDRTYAREISYQLETIMILMRQIRSTTGNEKFKIFLDSALVNLEPTQKSFAEFNAPQTAS